MPIIRRKRQLKIELLPTSSLISNPYNARRHSRRQIKKLARVIEKLGWATPLIIDELGVVLCGNGRLEAALELGLEEVPCIRVIDLTGAEKTALALADNKLGDESSFDETKLKSLLIELANVEFDMAATGFDPGEIDFHIDGPAGAITADPADAVLPEMAGDAVTQVGNLWRLGVHRLICGSALDGAVYERLLVGDLAQMVFVDCHTMSLSSDMCLD